MWKLLRFVLLVVIAVLLFQVVVTVGSDDAGVLEKALVVAFGLVLVLAASRVWRIGEPKLH